MTRLPFALVTLAACSGQPNPTHPTAASTAPLSLAKEPQMVVVPAGRFIAGSTVEERIAAYDDYLSTAGNDTAREKKWFEGEEDRHQVELPAFRIDLLPVTQAEFAEFVTAKKAAPPSIDADAWTKQGFIQAFTIVERFNWKEGVPPAGREDHPVVLVTWAEANAYCKWRGELAGADRRLPTEREYEKAARGDAGIAYPWGNAFEADKLNSAVNGPHDTTPVGQYTNGASPYGLLDMAGNVFQWTSTKWRDGSMTVKGSAWEDYGGVGRGASRHGRPVGARHVIVGFRCAGA